MKLLHFNDGDTVYVVIFTMTPDGPTLESVWRGFNGRLTLERSTISALPWSARQVVCEIINEPLP